MGKIIDSLKNFIADARQTNSSLSSNFNNGHEYKTNIVEPTQYYNKNSAKVVSTQPSAPAITVPKATTNSTSSFVPTSVNVVTPVKQPSDSLVIQPVGGSSVDVGSLVQSAQKMAESNNAQYLANVKQQQEYNSLEAQKNRDWQEYMSNTAHQREVADLIAAGLNPLLSVNGGAAVTSGATASSSVADVDTNITNLLGNYVTSLINSATQINTARMNADANLASAGMSAKATQYLADAQRSASISSSSINSASNFISNMARLAILVSMGRI